MGLKEKCLVAARRADSLKKNVEGSFINTRCKLVGAVGAGVGALLPTMSVYADTKENEWDFLKDEGNGTFDSMTTTVKETGASGYKLIMAIGIVGLVFSIVITGLSLAANKSPQKRDENKTHLLWICAAGILIFGAMTFVGFLKTIAVSL